MKVYTHYLKTNCIEYRWRTLLQIGDSWEVRGTIFMKNPGSSINLENNKKPIKNESLLEKLRGFEDTEVSLDYDWYEFSIDNTMTCVKQLFESYYQAQQLPLNGVIQIFNLFNIREANLGKARDKSKGDIMNELAYTTNYDIRQIISPVYIGWGDLWKDPTYRKNAEQIFSEVKRKTSYLCDDIKNNKYYHPQYLLNYGRNKVDCIIELTRFIKGEYNLEEFDNIKNLVQLKRIIKANGVISKLVNGCTLTYEYFCNGNDGFKRHNGTISIGLEYNNHNYILSVLSKGNHPELFSEMIKNFCITDGVFKISNNNYIANTSITYIADFVERLLKEMKIYREKDISNFNSTNRYH